MNAIVMSPATLTSVQAAQSSNRRRWLAVYLGTCLLAGPVALIALRSGSGLRPVAVTMLGIGACAVLSRPILGVYLSAFFGFLGDSQTAWWYPFTKNLSSRESILFLHDAAILSPLELYLVLTFLAWGLQRLGGRTMPARRGSLFWPLAIFTAFTVMALLHGLATGGDAVMALRQIRPLLLPVTMYTLASALLTHRAHYDRLLWTIVAALVLEAVHGAYVIATLSGVAAERAQGLGYLEHSASLHFNTVFVLCAAAWVYRRSSPRKRIVLPLLSGIVLVAYLPAERRSAIVALIAAGILLAIVLLRENRRAFWLLVPVVGLTALAYLAVFWNGHGSLAFPAQAVKSVLAPEQLGAADASSNLYRQVETYNLLSTIRSAPLLGIGLGQPFHQVFPLPYIPFEWAKYLPHNSILWIWISTGIGGFVAMLYLLSLSVRNGAATAARLRGDDAALATTAVLYVVMYLIYAYVDIGWDTQSMLYLGVALAVIDNLERLEPRWTAQAVSVAAAGRGTTDGTPAAAGV